MANKVFDTRGQIRSGALFATEYKNKAFAIAEVIDNAIDAGAKNIGIIIRTKKNEYDSDNDVVELYIMNDGKPLDKNGLEKSLSFGSSSEDEKKIGRFGVGFKQALFSICKGIEFYSINDLKNKKVIKAKFDPLEMLKQEGEIVIQDATTVDYYDSFGGIPNFDLMVKKIKMNNEATNNITVVRAYKFNAGITKKQLSKELENNLSNIFRYYLTKSDKVALNLERKETVNIFYQFDDGNDKIKTFKPSDPLFIMSDDEFTYNRETFEKHNNLLDLNNSNFTNAFETHEVEKLNKQMDVKFIDGQYVYERIVNVIDEFTGKNYEGKYWIKCSVIKEEWFINQKTDKPGSTKLGEEMGARSDRGSYRFVRNGREIDYGNYRFSKARREDRYWAVEIHFSKELDTVLGLTSNKQKISLVNSKSNNGKIIARMRFEISEAMQSLKSAYKNILSKKNKIKLECITEDNKASIDEVKAINVFKDEVKNFAGNIVKETSLENDFKFLKIDDYIEKLNNKTNNNKGIIFKEIIKKSNIDENSDVVLSRIYNKVNNKEKIIICVINKLLIKEIIINLSTEEFQKIKSLF